MWRCGGLRDEVGEPAVVDPLADAHEFGVAASFGLPRATATNGIGSRFMEPWKITPAAMPSWS